MLDADTKRRIDTARDILVGKVPDPKSQVEQITIALIYKFMDDLDAESEELGGQRKFFAGEFERYGWAKLTGPGVGGYEMLNLYAEAITRMPENPGIPLLFRDIFNNAYLPYRDPETLRAFLKVIDEFTYDHSERLGDAFEYLLSILGAQGDAGQFRTPRHIIDFIVAVVDPKKGDVVLDPACGTAGFLISAYKHILATNTNSDGQSTLTPDARGQLVNNFMGYDISPDMVRLSLVNMYLHGFREPHIHEYDTLTSEERWNEYADVILANPPFMSPRGGIRPHNRFSVKSARSEVLFVDYMAEHLSANGRAGIIVPEGIVFQSQTAYRHLRKMLVERYLVAVVSLPAGVFNPYSGVKTSIFILDRPLAKRTDVIAFFRVDSDGFDLGAQRRPIAKNDLPDVKTELIEYLGHLRVGEPLESIEPILGQVVLKETIAEDGDYNLSGERYRDSGARDANWPIVAVKDLFRRSRETVLPEFVNGPATYVGLEHITQDTGQLCGNVVIEEPARIKSLKTVFCTNDILYGRLRPNLNKVWLADRDGFCSTDILVIRPAGKEALPELYAYLFRSHEFNSVVLRRVTGAQLPRISWAQFKNLAISLPSLDVQREIVAEVTGYQRVINGARAVVENYRPHIVVDSEWPLVEIGAVCQLINGRAFKPRDWEAADSGGIPIVRIQNLNTPGSEANYFTGKVSSRHIVDQGQLLFSWSGSRGTSFGAHIWNGGRAVLNQHIFKVGFDETRADKMYLFYALNMAVKEVEQNLHGGVGLVHITKGNLERIRISLPSIAIQQAVVADLQEEQALVDANRQLVGRFEGKIQAAMARVWESDASAARDA